jgi:hypothetical protein
MTKNEKIQAIKPLKSEFNNLSKKFDRILRYPDTDRSVIKENRTKKMWIILAKMTVVFRQMQMILSTPMPEFLKGGLDNVDSALG